MILIQPAINHFDVQDPGDPGPQRGLLGHAPRGLRGIRGFAGSAAVESLQRALTNLAIATNRPAINPGVVTGTVDDSTMIALSSAMGIIAEEMPDYIYLPLQAVMMLGVTSTTAKKTVTSYAAAITIALNAAAIKFKQNPALPVLPPPPAAAPSFMDTLFPVGWYKKPSWGLALVGLGALLAFKSFSKPAATKAA